MGNQKYYSAKALVVGIDKYDQVTQFDVVNQYREVA